MGKFSLNKTYSSSLDNISGAGSETQLNDSCIVVSPTKPADLENGLWIESDLVDKNINILNIEDKSILKGAVEQLSNSNEYCAQCGVCKIGKLVYLFGSGRYCTSNKIQIYNITTDTFTTLQTTLPTAKPYPVLGFLNNSIYIGFEYSIYSFDIINQTLTRHCGSTYKINNYYVYNSTYSITVNNKIYYIVPDSSSTGMLCLDPINKTVTTTSLHINNSSDSYRLLRQYNEFIYIYRGASSKIFSDDGFTKYDTINNVSTTISIGKSVTLGNSDYTRCLFDPNYEYVHSISYNGDYEIFDFINFESKYSTKFNFSMNTYLGNSNYAEPGCVFYDDGYFYVFNTCSASSSKYSRNCIKLSEFGMYLSDSNLINMYSNSIVLLVDINTSKNEFLDKYVCLNNKANMYEYYKIIGCFYLGTNFTKSLRTNKIINGQVMDYKLY